jgi:hypothetical protein
VSPAAVPTWAPRRSNEDRRSACSRDPEREHHFVHERANPPGGSMGSGDRRSLAGSQGQSPAALRAFSPRHTGRRNWIQRSRPLVRTRLRFASEWQFRLGDRIRPVIAFPDDLGQFALIHQSVHSSRPPPCMAAAWSTSCAGISCRRTIATIRTPTNCPGSACAHRPCASGRGAAAPAPGRRRPPSDSAGQTFH